jgi:mannosyltransferase
MATVSRPLTATVANRARELGARLPARGLPLMLFALAVILGWSLYLRTRTLGSPFWIDEGLSVGIGSHALSAIPDVLRQDGSPPFYYLLLNLWMRVFGEGEAQTQALSLVFAIACIPVAFWLADSIWGRRAAWFCALLFAVNPYMTIHGQETRMYALVALLGLLATGAFLQAFVLRNRRWLFALPVLLALMLYTHNWSVFFLAGVCAALAWVVLSAPEHARRELLRDAAIALGGAFLLYLPWLPTLIYQAAHTGAPWSTVPSFGAIWREVASTLGGAGPSVAALLAGGGALWAILRGPRGRERTLVSALGLVLLGTLLSAWAASQVEPAWANRYFAVAIGPLLLLVAAMLSRAGGLGIAALVVALVFAGQPHGFADSTTLERNVGKGVAPLLRDGDLVIVTHPERVPLMHYYLPDGLRYASTLGRARDPLVMDWRDAQERLETTYPTRTLGRLLATVPPGGRVVLVRPVIRSDVGWDAPWTKLVKHRSAQWGRQLAADERFARILAEPESFGDRFRGVRAVVYERSR